MGSYNVLCSVSRHVVECGDKVKLIPFSNGSCISPVVIDAVYDDYGYFEIDSSKGTSKGLEALSSTLATVDTEYTKENTLQKMNCCTLKLKDEYSGKEHPVGFVVVLSDVYDYLVSESKEKYKDNYRKLHERNIKRAIATSSDKITDTKEERLDKIKSFFDYLNREGDTKDLAVIMQEKYNKVLAGVGCTDVIKELSKSGLVDPEIMSVYAVGTVIENIQDFIDLEFFLMYAKYDLDLELPLQENAKQTENNFEKFRVISEVQRIAFNQTNLHFKIQKEKEVKLTITRECVDEYINENSWCGGAQLFNADGVYKGTDKAESSLVPYLRDDVFIIAPKYCNKVIEPLNPYVATETKFEKDGYTHVFGVYEMNPADHYYKKYDASGKCVELHSSNAPHDNVKFEYPED